MQPRVFVDDEAVATALAAELTGIITGPPAHILLAGGTTPRRAYELVAAHASATHLWFGDERMVPSEHADSNFGMARRAWLDRVEYPAAQVHRIVGELGATEAARRATAELNRHLGAAPRFDLVILGLGTDGHTASLFPEDPAVDAAGSFVPARADARVTATLELLCAARRVVFVAVGAKKAEAVAAVLGGANLPAARVQGPEITWLLDRAAAANVQPSVGY